MCNTLALSAYKMRVSTVTVRDCVILLPRVALRHSLPIPNQTLRPRWLLLQHPITFHVAKEQKALYIGA